MGDVPPRKTLMGEFRPSPVGPKPYSGRGRVPIDNGVI